MSGSPRTSRCSRSVSSAARRSAPAGRPSGRASSRQGGGGLPRGAGAPRPRSSITDDELARARALVEADELGALQRVEERADRLSMYATLFDDPDLINRMLTRYLAVDAGGHPDRWPPRCSARTTALVLTYLPRAATPAETATRPAAEPAA